MAYKLVVYGFLGAGKTTLVNHLAREVLPRRRIVVIENESGRESVDGELLRSRGLDVVDLRAGCVCCTLRGELAAAVERIEREAEPEILILEPSGIGALEELLQIPGFTPDAVVTLVDVERFDLLMRLNREFYLRQFRLSPVLLLTKCDKAGRQQTERVRRELEAIHPQALVSAAWHTLDAAWWLGTLRDVYSRFRAYMPQRGTPATQFILHTFDPVRTLDPVRLVRRLRRRAGRDGAPVRVKGVVDTPRGTMRIDAAGSHVEAVPAAHGTPAKRFLTFWWCEPYGGQASLREAEELINACTP